jgi:cellulose synthase (UDP-forming)
MASSGRVEPGEGTEYQDAPAAPQSAIERFIQRTLDSPVALVLLIIGCLLPLVIFVTYPLPIRAHIVLSLLLVAVGLFTVARFPHMRLVIVVLSLAASFRYMLFRGTETLALDSWGDTFTSVGLYVAELYALITLVGGYFQTAIVRRNQPVPIDDVPPNQLPWVDIFIPTYDEDDQVLRPTVLGAAAIDYPNKRVFVLDDGRKVKGEARAWVEDLCREVGATYVARTDGKGAKAGNINHALQYAKGDLVAIFDADHVPNRDFLNATVGFFVVNPDVALVQTPHHFYNSDPFVRNLYLDGLVPGEQHLFYHGIQLGNDFWNAAFFCGSCAVLRREALDEVGGVTEITVTEDAHTALQMHANGWDSVYLDVPLAAGLATESYSAHIGQRIRWARGMAQIFRLDNPLIKPGLSLAQRLSYFQASWYFLFGLPRLLFIVTPALYLSFDFHPLDANVREVLVYAIPHLVLAALGSVTMNRNVRHSLWPEVYEVAIAPYTALVTTLAFIAPKRGKFNVTAKGATFDRVRFDFRNTLPLLVIAGLIVWGFVQVPFKIRDNVLDVDTILVAAAWNLYNFIVLVAAILAALERPQRRRFHRVARSAGVMLLAGDAADAAWFAPLEGTTVDLSMGGLAARFPGRHDLPVQAAVELSNPWARSVPLPIQPVGVEYLSEEDVTVVRANFSPLDTRQQSDLARQIFGATDAWAGERFRFDSYWRGVTSVMVAILAVGLGNPTWLRRFMAPNQGEQLGTLVPGVEHSRCVNCGAAMLEGAVRCGACGALQPDELVPVQPVQLQAEVRGVRPMVLPAVLLVLAALLAFGYSPVVDAVSQAVPLNKWEKVPYQTRKGELAQATHRIHALHGELERTVLRARPVDGRFSRKVWEVKRDYSLMTPIVEDESTREVEVALETSVAAIEEARAAYDPKNPSDPAVRDALDRAEVNLGRAANRLGIPL